MARCYALDGFTPVADPSAFLHPEAVLIGDVHVGPGAYIGPGAVLRGDFGRVIVGARANVQETCVMHAFPGRDVVVEEMGHIGHGAVLHGCVVGANAMVGMNAVVMDEAVIGAESIVAALAFVKAGMQVPPRSMVVGMPARIVRQLSGEEVAWKTRGTEVYAELARTAAARLRPAEPLPRAEPGRGRMAAPDHRPKSTPGA
ncbi:transferase hexapeptide repeat family protein [Paroceanicella profunda]|uniref:Transferase hexapeptide repeat family protein n=1 Tax=Paroceanicella profunda TaxID=2579971 RepID=A0A5B8FHF0_9RHOB|nr:transferase hexapeptide repeat family protein [Paroceanicella profunda]QDL91928.1 transferase hexapeptide repeat family protein [Paroceanicella profunda]